MTNFLLRIFGAKADCPAEQARDLLGRLAGYVGIASNLLLFCLKLIAGTLSSSISITADAVNNLSDCASSIITLVGFRLAGLPADEEHPYGHARFEYISGLAVAVLVLLIALEFLKSSVRKILNPAPVEFSAAVAAVLICSILVKLWQRGFNRRVGKEIDSGALIAAAADSRNDVITTLVVLLAAVVAHFTGWSLDGWIGAAVAVFLLISGVRLVLETLDPLLGMAPSRELVEQIRHKITGYPSIIGFHDLMVHNYGPGRCFASVHVEVSANQDIMISHDVIDNIERDFLDDMNIHLVAHLDPIVMDDARTNDMRERVSQAVFAADPELSMHDFRMVEGKTHTNLIFDVVVPPRYKFTDRQLRAEISARVHAPDANIYCVITIDRSYTSTTQQIKD